MSSLTTLFQRVRNKAAIELSYAAHTAGHWVARKLANVDEDPTARARAAELHERGVVGIPPDARITEFVQRVYQAEMRPAWDALEGTWRDPPTGGTYKVFLSDVCERWPPVLELLDGEVAAMLRAYYGCQFEYTYVEPYRVFPREGELPKSWLWHYDSVAPGILKLMIYLNGADRSSGALRVLDHAASQDMERRGFRTRADSDALARDFEDRAVAYEGGPGHAVIIDNRVLHKATAPEKTIRDVVCFQILPSTRSEHAARTRAGVSRSYTRNTPQFPFLPPALRRYR